MQTRIAPKFALHRFTRFIFPAAAIADSALRKEWCGLHERLLAKHFLPLCFPVRLLNLELLEYGR
jgi:hypothetical protein